MRTHIYPSLAQHTHAHTYIHTYIQTYTSAFQWHNACPSIAMERFITHTYTHTHTHTLIVAYNMNPIPIPIQKRKKRTLECINHAFPCCPLFFKPNEQNLWIYLFIFFLPSKNKRLIITPRYYGARRSSRSYNKLAAFHLLRVFKKNNSIRCPESAQQWRLRNNQVGNWKHLIRNRRKQNSRTCSSHHYATSENLCNYCLSLSHTHTSFPNNACPRPSNREITCFLPVVLASRPSGRVCHFIKKFCVIPVSFPFLHTHTHPRTHTDEENQYAEKKKENRFISSDPIVYEQHFKLYSVSLSSHCFHIHDVTIIRHHLRSRIPPNSARPESHSFKPRN